MNDVTVRLTKEGESSTWLFFVDAVLYQPNGFKTEKEAFSAGLKKVDELKKAKYKKA